MSTLFQQFDLREVLENQQKKLIEKVDRYTNDEIMANSLEILANNCYEEFYIEPVTIGEEQVSRRDAIQQKIEVELDPIWQSRTSRHTSMIDGVNMQFYFPFTGDKKLLFSKASTYSLSGYKEAEVYNDSFCLSYKLKLAELKNEEGMKRLLRQLDHDVSSIKQGVGYANKDVTAFNISLHAFADAELKKRKAKVEQYYRISSWFQIPVIKTQYAETHLPVKRKIAPIKKSYSNETNYYISDDEYYDILNTIHHNCSTFERTPASYKELHEEDLRNILLASLNGFYQGIATGEAFRKNGKTDICIETISRAAFVAECKIWKGNSSVSGALKQLDGYLTWRDCKTALIYFVRNKDFIGVLNSMHEVLGKVDSISQIKEIDKNRIECIMSSQSNLNQHVKVVVMLYNLFC